MEWFGIITGSIGAILGAYGAWRSWRTDSANKLLSRKWEIAPQMSGRADYLLINRMPKQAFDVKVAAPDGHLVEQMTEGQVDLPPNGERLYSVLVFYQHDPGPVTVSWSHRNRPGAPRRTWSGHLPAHIAPNPFA